MRLRALCARRFASSPLRLGPRHCGSDEGRVQRDRLPRRVGCLVRLGTYPHAQAAEPHVRPVGFMRDDSRVR